MEFTHFDENGNAHMVDVTEKIATVREARAQGYIGVSAQCFALIQQGGMAKGDVLGVARIAGIMGAKKTSELIPLCHILNLTKVNLSFELLGVAESLQQADAEGGEAWVASQAEFAGLPAGYHYIKAVCTAKCSGKTGVEMEALTGVSTALLTIYDMCKAVDKGMLITGICLMEKTGGKSGHYLREN